MVESVNMILFHLLKTNLLFQDIIKKINYLDVDEESKPKRLVMIEDCGLVRHDPYIMPEEQRYA